MSLLGLPPRDTSNGHPLGYRRTAFYALALPARLSLDGIRTTPFLMKTILSSLLLFSGFCLASETMLATVYQPLNGFGGDGLQIMAVVCKNHYATSGMPCVELITKPNLAPTNSPEGPTDINLASGEKLQLRYSEKDNNPEHPVFTLDCSLAKRQPDHVDPAWLVRATLECLRLSFPEEVAEAEFVFIIPDGMDDVRAVTAEFTAHDKTLPFFKRPE